MVSDKTVTGFFAGNGSAAMAGTIKAEIRPIPIKTVARKTLHAERGIKEIQPCISSPRS
jgi:hypothetical protein